MGIDQALKAGA